MGNGAFADQSPRIEDAIASDLSFVSHNRPEFFQTRLHFRSLVKNGHLFSIEPQIRALDSCAEVGPAAYDRIA